METVTFIDSIPCSSKVTFSPNGLFIADSDFNLDKMRVRNVFDELDIFSFKTVLSKIDSVQWSSDSIYVAFGSKEQAIIQVYSLGNKKWKCKIDIGNEYEGGVGLLDFTWSPTSRHLLTTANEYIQLTIWSLEDKEDVNYINDIVPIQEYKSFSPQGNQLAVVRFNPDNGQKFVSIYKASNWTKSASNFSISAKDVIGIRWIPNGNILIWDSPLFSKMYIYNEGGELLRHYSPDGLALGIQIIESSPTGQFIAFTNHKNQFRVINTASYGLCIDETLDESLLEDFPDCVNYSEKLTSSSSSAVRKYEIRKELNINLNSSRVDSETGVIASYIRISSNGKLIAVSHTKLSSMLWIWDISSTKLISVLVHQKTITDFNWHPNEECLCLVTGNETLYFWTPGGTYTIQIPGSDFVAKNIEWNPTGICILVRNDEKFTICYLKERTQKNSN